MTETNNCAVEPRENRVGSFKRSLKANVWLFLSTATYLVTLFAVQDHPEWSPMVRVGLKLLPLVPGVIFLRMLWGTFKTMDELERRIQLEAFAFGLAGTVIVGTAINVLNANGAGLENYPHGLELGGAYISVFIFWCVGVAQAKARYQ